ncbi:alpha/beta fold hydrolase [Hyphomonas sp.]|uniref:alpha/beta fold hydrolase n=1 Tax=Hyphomonas sp. TaxID=87 RepID=UPI0035292F09
MDDLTAQAEALLADMKPLSPSAAPGQNMLPPNTRRDIEGKYGASPVWRAGDAPATLFVHGWDDTHRVWRQFAMDFIQNQRPAILMDLPGHGASGIESAGWAVAGTSVREVCDAEGPIDTIIAHSFGCIATLRAVELGAKADYLVLIAPPLSEGKGGFQERQKKKGYSDEVIARAEQLHLERTGLPLSRTNFLRVVESFSGKVLIVGSHADSECPLEAMETMAEGLPNVTVYAVDTLGHRELAQDHGILADVLDFLGY